MILELKQTFATNFVAYYRTHSSHVNVQGRNFYSDHKLLGKIYQDLQQDIDSLAEFLRIFRESMPTTLIGAQEFSLITDFEITGTSLDRLQVCLEDLTQLSISYNELEQAARDAEPSIAAFAQERLIMLRRWMWQLLSTINPDQDQD